MTIYRVTRINQSFAVADFDLPWFIPRDLFWFSRKLDMIFDCGGTNALMSIFSYDLVRER